jgi:hypothetical protein
MAGITGMRIAAIVRAGYLRGIKRNDKVLPACSIFGDVKTISAERSSNKVVMFITSRVACAPTGRPFTRQSRPVKYLMERLCEQAGIQSGRLVKFFTFYAFRHFVATRLRDSGKASIYEIQHILGHKRSETTDGYLKGLAPDVKGAVASLDKVIDMGEIPDAQPKKSKVIKFARG